LWQPQFIKTQYCKDAELWPTLSRQQNEDGEGMGAAGSEPAKNGDRRSLFIDVAGHRIILFREG
jgi:hypothetical protein